MLGYVVEDRWSENELLFGLSNGKSVPELTVLDDPEFGREVLVRFTDATQLSIAVGVKQTIDVRYCSEETPDQPFFIRQD